MSLGVVLVMHVEAVASIDFDGCCSRQRWFFYAIRGNNLRHGYSLSGSGRSFLGGPARCLPGLELERHIFRVSVD